MVVSSKTTSIKFFMLANWPKALISSFIGLFLYVYLFFSETGYFLSIENNLPVMIYVVLLSNLAGYVIRLSGRFMNKFLSWHSNTNTRLLVSILGNYLIMLLVYFIGMVIYAQFGLHSVNLSDLYSQYSDPLIKLLILTFLITFIYSIVDFTMYSYDQYAHGQIESVILERKQIELQFMALKSQISPHYLFNCFNTIASLVYKSPESTETFIRRLVQTYQYILNTQNKKLVVLSDELEFVKAYNYLLKVRFESAFQIKIDLPDSIMNSQIPPMTLQMLIENAVKHNVLSDDDPLKVAIELSNERELSISNNKNKKNHNGTSHSIGLENIRLRYKYFTKKPIKIINQDQFEVKLPCLYIPSANEENIYS